MEKTVLIVDDSNTNNFLLQSILDMEGIKSDIAFSGTEALKLMELKKPSLILLDIMMPDIDGFSVLNQLKNNPKTETVPVIFITANSDNQILQKALEAGATSLLYKPVDVNKVVELVKTILN